MCDPQCLKNPFVSFAGGLRAVIRHQVDAVGSTPKRARYFDSPSECPQPELSFGPETESMAKRPLGIPIDDDNQIQPPDVRDIELGHVRPPPLIPFGGLWLGTRFLPLDLVALDGDREAVGSHDPADALTVDHHASFLPQIGRDPSVTPERMLTGKLPNRTGKVKLLCHRRLIRTRKRRTSSALARAAVIACPRNPEDLTGPTHRDPFSLELRDQFVLGQSSFRFFFNTCISTACLPIT